MDKLLERKLRARVDADEKMLAAKQTATKSAVLNEGEYEECFNCGRPKDEHSDTGRCLSQRGGRLTSWERVIVVKNPFLKKGKGK